VHRFGVQAGGVFTNQ